MTTPYEENAKSNAERTGQAEKPDKVQSTKKKTKKKTSKKTG